MGLSELYLAGGCFWGIEALFSAIPGVLETECGYANGLAENPRYEEVCTGRTGHAEVVRVRYDARILPLDALLDWYFRAIDRLAIEVRSTTQYRLGVYYADSADEAGVRAAFEKAQLRFPEPLQVEHGPLLRYYPAEDYHQHYLETYPGAYCHVPEALLLEARRMGR